MKKVNPVEDALEREIQDLLARQPDVLDAHQIARHHRLRLPHRQPLVHRGEVKVFSLSAQL